MGPDDVADWADLRDLTERQQGAWRHIALTGTDHPNTARQVRPVRSVRPVRLAGQRRATQIRRFADRQPQ